MWSFLDGSGIMLGELLVALSPRLAEAALYSPDSRMTDKQKMTSSVVCSKKYFSPNSVGTLRGSYGSRKAADA